MPRQRGSEVNEEDETVEVTFFIEPGNRTYVNRINFSGNLSTADDVLRREMRQLESAPASSIQIEQSKVRLERLGYFETVEVETEEVPGTEDQVDVNYDVVEQNFGAVSFQVGTGGGGNFSSVRICRRKIFWEPVEQWVSASTGADSRVA